MSGDLGADEGGKLTTVPFVQDDGDDLPERVERLEETVDDLFARLGARSLGQCHHCESGTLVLSSGAIACTDCEYRRRF